MNELAGLSSAVWGINIAAASILVASLLLRRNHREYPVFFLYISASLMQSLALFLSYRIWGFNSYAAWCMAWATQTVVLSARALAIAEICHCLFESYRGIWELIRRVLLFSAAVVLLYAVIVARHKWLLIMPNIQRGIDLAIVTCLVGLFLFARYYGIQPSSALGALALGFLLFSSFEVLNSTVLERSLDTYAPLWTVLQMIAFFASVVIWTGGLWQHQVAGEPFQMLASSGLYRSLTPEVNQKLRHLNEQLSRFLNVEADQR